MSNSTNDNKNYEGVKAFLIARVSDTRQTDALPAQTTRLEMYAEKLKLNGQFFSFDETASKDDRQKFKKIVKEVYDYPEFCVVVFDKIDRFTRDASSEVVQIMKQLVKDGKIELHFPSDNLFYHKNSPAADKTRLGMGMVFGEYYAAAISDNVKRRIEQKLNDGEYPGKACIGYTNIKLDAINPVTKEPYKDIVPDPEREPYIVKAFELRLAGNSFRTIAKILKEDGLRSNTKQMKPVGQSQIETMLKNTFYYGVMKYDGQYYPHKYRPIITKELFDLVQKVNDERNTDDHSKTDTKQTFTFSGILKCATCGCSISSYVKKGHVYMRCTKAKPGVHCEQPHVSEAELLPQVTHLLDELTVSQSNAEKIMELLKDQHNNVVMFYQNAIKQKTAEHKKLQRKIDTLYDDRLDGRITVDEYDKYVVKAKAEMDKLDAELVDLNKGNTSFIVTAEYLLELASRSKELFESSQPAQKNKILRALLANLNLNQKKLQLNLLQPFHGLVLNQKSSSWLRRLDSNQQPRS